MNFRFQHKELVWLLAGAVLLTGLFLLLLQWKKNVRKNLGDERLVTLLTAGFSPRHFLLKFILLLGAFILCVFAAMNPKKPGRNSSVTRNGIDLAIALDVSKSMLAADMAPSRLERAKQFINKLMNEMPDDRIALILFAGKAYMQMPLTTDHTAAWLFISGAGPGSVPQQGTAISDALEMSARVFGNSEKRFRAVLLISDGEDHEDDAGTVAGRLAEQGVMINTVGIGSEEGSVIPDPASGGIKTDESGNTVISKLNSSLLKEIADKTNGKYIHLQSSDEAVVAVKAQLSQIDRKAYSDMAGMSFIYLFPWLAGAAFVLLSAGLFISERKKTALV